ncbi:hypothetical protein PAEPH01_2236, partial [Pancytospora epiphaga]
MIKHGLKKGESVKGNDEIEKFIAVQEMKNCKEKFEKLVLLNPDHYMAWNELKKIFIENPLDTMEEQMLLT